MVRDRGYTIQQLKERWELHLDELLVDDGVVCVHEVRSYIHRLLTPIKQYILYTGQCKTFGKAFLASWSMLFLPIVGIDAALNTNWIVLSCAWKHMIN